MKVAITWSTWFVWKYLAERFANNWWDVIAFWRKDKWSFENWNIRYIQWDITNRVNSSLLNEHLDLFIHSASDTNWKKSVEEMISINKDSVWNILELANNTSHCIYISTSAVYQWIEWWNINEERKIDIHNLKNSYALSKYLAEEELIKCIWNNTKLSIIRPRAIYWKWDRLLIPWILEVSILNRLVMFWKGNNKMSVTHINNLYNAILFLFKNQQSKSDIYNVTDPDTTTMNYVYNLLKDKYWKKWIIHIPEIILSLLLQFRENNLSYMKDIFCREKVLNTQKISKLWFIADDYELKKVIDEEY